MLGFVFGALAGVFVGFVFIFVIHVFQAPPTTPPMEDYSALAPYLFAFAGAPIGAVVCAIGGGVRAWIATAADDKAARYRAATWRWLFIRGPVIVLIVVGWISGAAVFGRLQRTRFDPSRLRTDWDLQAPRLAAIATFVGFAIVAAIWGIWATRRERRAKTGAQ